MDFVPDFATEKSIDTYGNCFMVRDWVEAGHSNFFPSLDPQILGITNVTPQEPTVVSFFGTQIVACLDPNREFFNLFVVFSHLLC